MQKTTLESVNDAVKSLNAKQERTTGENIALNKLKSVVVILDRKMEPPKQRPGVESA